jgi:hypothetical protein
MTKHKKSRKAQMGGLFGWGEENQSMYSQNQYGQKKPWYDVSSWGFGSSSGNQSQSYSNPNESSFFGSSSGNQSQSYSNPNQSSFFGSSSGNQPYSNQSYSNRSYNPNQSYSQSRYGGKGKRRTVRMNGGKMSELNAAPVGGLKVARPTYFLKNGGKKQKTQRRRKH